MPSVIALPRQEVELSCSLCFITCRVSHVRSPVLLVCIHVLWLWAVSLLLQCSRLASPEAAAQRVHLNTPMRLRPALPPLCAGAVAGSSHVLFFPVHDCWLACHI